jgi:hypothetical protein
MKESQNLVFFLVIYLSLLQDKGRFIEYFIMGLKHLLKSAERQICIIVRPLALEKELSYASHNVQSETKAEII